MVLLASTRGLDGLISLIWVLIINEEEVKYVWQISYPPAIGASQGPDQIKIRILKKF